MFHLYRPLLKALDLKKVRADMKRWVHQEIEDGHLTCWAQAKGLIMPQKKYADEVNCDGSEGFEMYFDYDDTVEGASRAGENSSSDDEQADEKKLPEDVPFGESDKSDFDHGDDSDIALLDSSEDEADVDNLVQHLEDAMNAVEKEARGEHEPVLRQVLDLLLEQGGPREMIKYTKGLLTSTKLNKKKLQGCEADIAYLDATSAARRKSMKAEAMETEAAKANLVHLSEADKISKLNAQKEKDAKRLETIAAEKTARLEDKALRVQELAAQGLVRVHQQWLASFICKDLQVTWSESDDRARSKLRRRVDDFVVLGKGNKSMDVPEFWDGNQHSHQCGKLPPCHGGHPMYASEAFLCTMSFPHRIICLLLVF